MVDIMTYVKRQISLPDELNERLKGELNASATIVKGLELYYKRQEAASKLIKASETYDAVYESIDSLIVEVKRLTKYVEQAGRGY